MRELNGATSVGTCRRDKFSFNHYVHRVCGIAFFEKKTTRFNLDERKVADQIPQNNGIQCAQKRGVFQSETASTRFIVHELEYDFVLAFDRGNGKRAERI